jgi:NAD(P)-dependent dehydrogenase (short-subunit alcohol dehydrogenase family)
MLLCSTGACLQKLPCQGWTAAVFIKCFKSMPLAPFLFPRYGHPQLFVDLKLLVHHATTSQLLCLPQAFMPLLAKGAKDGNTPRYCRLASTELLVLMPLRCTLALTLHWHDTAATCPANHLARAIHHLTCCSCITGHINLSHCRARPSVIANMSARVGSITDNRLGGWYSYRASKTALNQLTKTMAIECTRRKMNVSCIMLHPGTVDTDLSAPFQKVWPWLGMQNNLAA